MPLFYQHSLSPHTRLAVWIIEEGENFFAHIERHPTDIPHPQKRLQHLAGRHLLTLLQPGIDLNRIELPPRQKPLMPVGEGWFSVSHCAHVAAAIWSDTAPVGIDVEMKTGKALRLRQKFSKDLEWVQWQSFTDQMDDEERATLLWSAKESMYKWAGEKGIEFRDQLLVQKLVKQEITATFKKTQLENSVELEWRQWGKLFLTYTLPG